MPSPARVTSIEAIEAFRTALILYVSQARPTLEEISADVMRARSWLEEEQRVKWEHELRKRSKTLEEAQQSLFSSRIGLLAKEGAAQQMAVHKAKHLVDEAQDKLRAVKRWRRDFDGRVQPLVKQTEKLHTLMTQDLVQAISLLTRIQNTLAAYADKTAVEPVGAPMAPPSNAAGVPPAANQPGGTQ
jgi:hypothetical protein